MSRRLRVAMAAFFVGAATLSSACHVTGPRSIRSGRHHYNAAIQETNNQQLLLNLVRLHYRDTPHFLEISAIASNFSFELGSSAGGAFNPSLGNSGTLGGNIGYVERPTVTYTPIQGQRAVTQLLTPLDLQVILLMYHSGWAIDRIFKICFQRLGPLDNASRASGPTPPTPPVHADYFEAMTILRELWIAGAIDMGYTESERGEALVIKISDELAYSPRTRRLSELLGLPEPRRTLVFSDRDPLGIPIVRRSLMAALFYLSQGVEVPDRDRSAGRVTTTRNPDGSDFDWTTITGDLMRIRHQRTQPTGAYVATYYRDRWFYIDDSDLDSKSTFALITQLFELQSGEIKQAGPLLTIPVSN